MTYGYSLYYIWLQSSVLSLPGEERRDEVHRHNEGARLRIRDTVANDELRARGGGNRTRGGGTRLRHQTPRRRRSENPLPADAKTAPGFYLQLQSPRQHSRTTVHLVSAGNERCVQGQGKREASGNLLATRSGEEYSPANTIAYPRLDLSVRCGYDHRCY